MTGQRIKCEEGTCVKRAGHSGEHRMADLRTGSRERIVRLSDIRACPIMSLEASHYGLHGCACLREEQS